MSQDLNLSGCLNPFLARLRESVFPEARSSVEQISAEAAVTASVQLPAQPGLRVPKPAPADPIDWIDQLAALTAARLDPGAHGDLPQWIQAIESLPALPAGEPMLDQQAVGVRGPRPLSPSERQALEAALMALHPWRKGPFSLHGLELDAEWRSDLKWARLAEGIAPLEGRRVLDLGCGNGWYGYRMLGAGARLVLGIDPTLRFVAQFLAINRFIGEDRLGVLPMTDDELVAIAPEGSFDSLFSMGVLYHRRDPHRHLAGLRRLLRSNGELVLETLVLDEPGSRVLHPPDRYAQMRNVHALPTLDVLRDWLTEAGFHRPRLLDLSRTRTQEQRATPWMRFHSLADFLDPDNPDLTLEGHPAPTRALLTAQR